MLTSLVERVPAARGAIFCDHEGESVALAIRDPQLSEFDMKVFGAQLAALWHSSQERSKEAGAGAILELQASCSAGTLLCRSLPDGYYVLLLIGRGSPIATAAFALCAATAEIASAL
jgi:hypothetical protein